VSNSRIEWLDSAARSAHGPTVTGNDPAPLQPASYTKPPPTHCNRKHAMAQDHKSVKSLLTCSKCKLELRLFGIESETADRDLYTFECSKCGDLEVRGVKVK
jgi:hypothetical protein